MITLGYRLVLLIQSILLNLQARFGSSSVQGSASLENYYPNTLINLIKTNDWQELHRQYGDQLILFLLEHCAIFVTKDGDSFLIQIAGAALSEVKPLQATKIKGTPKHEVFERSKIFYAMPNRSHGEIVMGLHRKRTTIYQSLLTMGLKDLLNSRGNASLAKLTGDLFYQNCPLPSPTSPLLRGLRKLARRIRKRHRACHYEDLLAFHCPVGLTVDDPAEFISQSEAENDDGDIIIIQKLRKSKEQQMSMTRPHSYYQVEKFIMAVLGRVLPKAIIPFRGHLRKSNQKTRLFGGFCIRDSNFHKTSEI